MTWKQTHSVHLWLPPLWLASFFLAISPAAAEITQADADRIGNAVAAALQGEKLYTYPFDEYSVVPISEFLATDPFNVQTSVANLVDQWGATLNNILIEHLALIHALQLSSTNTQENVLSLLYNIQGDTSTYLHYLSPIDSSVTAIDTYLNTDYRWTSQSATALRVHDEELLDAILDLRTENDSNHYEQMQGMGNYYGDVTNGLSAAAADLSALRDMLEDGGNLDSLGTNPDDGTASSVLGEPDGQSITAPAAVQISLNNLDADLTTMNLTGGDSVITFWEETSLDWFTMPAARIDLASPRLSRAVSIMRDISVSIWWLCFFTSVYLLCRREVTYYASLAHTEGN